MKRLMAIMALLAIPVTALAAGNLTVKKLISTADDGKKFIDIANGVAITETATTGRLGYYNGDVWMANGTNWTTKKLLRNDDPAGYNKATTKSTSGNYTIGTTDAGEAYGGVIYVTGAATITIPAVTAGMSFTVITIGDVAVSVDPNASDKMILDGVTLDDGDKATNTSKSGDIISCSYYSADGWYCASGTKLGSHWSDGGA